MLRIISIALLFLTGCVVSSDSPLAPLSASKLQKQLIGAWRSTGRPDKPSLFVHVCSATGRRGTGPDPLMRFLIVTQPKDDQGTVMHSEFFGYFSTHSDQLYLNLMINMDYNFKKPHELTDTSFTEHKYQFLKVGVLTDDHVQLVPMSATAAARLVQADTLSGTVSRRKDSLAKITSVKLTSSTESLVAAVTNAKNSDLFDKDDFVLRLRRVK